jgi:IPT/TIG domain
MRAEKITYLIVVGVLLELGGCGSSSKSKAIQPSTTSLFTVSPAGAVAGSGDLTLTITGSNFVDDRIFDTSVVWVTEDVQKALVTTVLSSTQITAIAPAALLSRPATAQLQVFKHDNIEGTDQPIDNISFQVFAPGALAITDISPASATAGSHDLTVTVTGANLSCPRSQCRTILTWNDDTSLAIASISNSELTAVIPAASLTSPVNAHLQIQFCTRLTTFPFQHPTSSVFESLIAAPAPRWASRPRAT